MSGPLRYLRQSALEELRANVQANVARYNGDAPFLQAVFDGRTYTNDAKSTVVALPDLKLPDTDGNSHDLENAIALHSALKNLTRTQAADGRLWSYLSHSHYWQYMRRRWPVESAKNPVPYVAEHYFVSDSRSLVRNGLSRLWWFGAATFDPSRDDPYSLTKTMMHSADTRQQIMERQFWRNPEVLVPLLERIEFWNGNGHEFFRPRERFRELCSTFNAYGGSLILDALGPSEICAFVDEIATAQRPQKGGAP